MDVTIYWSADGENHGALQRCESPRRDGWSNRWVRFGGGEADGYYCVAVAGEGEETLRLATSRQHSLRAYLDWLDENVDAITVDGYPWWQSSRTDDGTGGDG